MSNSWERFKRCYTEHPSLGLSLDVSRMDFDDSFWDSMQPRMEQAFSDMEKLEGGAVANPDENRMVGHYWLRNPGLAPNDAIREAIESTIERVKNFAGNVHSGAIAGAGGAFENLLVIGIGGSALGPQFVAHALGHPSGDRMKPFFIDNTDPDGIDRILAALGESLGRTLVIVISKSGGTKETRNGMLEMKAAYETQGLEFEKHAVAVTGVGSNLDKIAKAGGWLARFPMWDWVGGRTSELSAVGLLPAALQGIDIDRMLIGARACDESTRVPETKTNPAAQLALMWHYSGNGKGEKDMVILPYKDRLELFSRYLQQLIMESLGKEKDLDGHVVRQGIAVYGNKGSTDQHAYIQQLREGVHNFFVTFIQVLEERDSRKTEVEPGITSGDYLNGFYLGTRQALHENGRESITITIREVTPFSVGVLIALYERAVGFYAGLVNINAYHQPGVEAGKKAAGRVLEIQQKVRNFLKKDCGSEMTAEAIAQGIGEEYQTETIFKICEHLAANRENGVIKTRQDSPFSATYRVG